MYSRGQTSGSICSRDCGAACCATTTTGNRMAYIVCALSFGWELAIRCFANFRAFTKCKCINPGSRARSESRLGSISSPNSSSKNSFRTGIPMKFSAPTKREKHGPRRNIVDHLLSRPRKTIKGGILDLLLGRTRLRESERNRPSIQGADKCRGRSPVGCRSSRAKASVRI